MKCDHSPPPQVYVYSFMIAPDDNYRHPRELRTVFEVIGRSQAGPGPGPWAHVQLTEAEFGPFRDALRNHGYTLWNVERVPYRQPESVR